jgi:hypothetical protein
MILNFLTSFFFWCEAAIKQPAQKKVDASLAVRELLNTQLVI